MDSFRTENILVVANPDAERRLKEYGFTNTKFKPGYIIPSSDYSALVCSDFKGIDFFLRCSRYISDKIPFFYIGENDEKLIVNGIYEILPDASNLGERLEQTLTKTHGLDELAYTLREFMPDIKIQIDDEVYYTRHGHNQGEYSNRGEPRQISRLEGRLQILEREIEKVRNSGIIRFPVRTKRSVGIIGFGDIGRTFATNILRYHVNIEVTSRKPKESVINSINDAYRGSIHYNHNVEELLQRSDLVYICIDANSVKSPDRSKLVRANASAIRDIAPKFNDYNGFLVMVTNEPEIMIKVLRDNSNIKKDQIIGLNEPEHIRFPIILKKCLEDYLKKPISVSDCYVGGIHSNPVPYFSFVRVDGECLSEFLEDPELKSIKEQITNELMTYGREVYELGDTIRENSVQGLISVLESYLNGKVICASFAFEDDIPLTQLCTIKWGMLKRLPYIKEPSEFSETLLRKEYVISRLTEL